METGGDFIWRLFVSLAKWVGFYFAAKMFEKLYENNYLANNSRGENTNKGSVLSAS